MKAVQISQYGGSEMLKLNNGLDKPVLKENQVLVEVYAASINPFDFFVIGGFSKDYIKQDFPLTIGGDFSGKIKEVGKEVSGFKIGDEVFGTAIILSGGSGAFAEFATVNPGRMSLRPKNIDFIQSASLPLVGSSAVQALEEEIKLKSGEKILVHGGAGGIGSIAIQLAKFIGAHVATTVSEQDREFVKNLGADEIIEYKTEKFEEKLKDYDAVYDTIGGNVMERSFKVLKKGGRLASMKGQPSPDLASQYGVTAIAVNTKNSTIHMDRVRELVEKMVIKPQVDKVFPLEETSTAFIYKMQNHPKGKVVIKIK
ncbi:NADP-dependent oxidoreductase [Candidatus Roizmanbacteria bacterium]|nr:NADP-dependent oxidoreductase [Candidatus Roizmanbacteria bacterium]